MPNLQKNILMICALLSLNSCTFSRRKETQLRQPSQITTTDWTAEKQFRSADPELVRALTAAYEKKSKSLSKKMNIAAVSPAQMKKLAQYLKFLEIPESLQEETLNRLLESSTQFLFCESLDDWSCLESTPTITPLALHRQETERDLGRPQNINENLKITPYFTKQWYKSRKNLIEQAEVTVPQKASLADELESRLNQNWQRVSGAIYGIDGIGEIDSSTKQPNFSMQKVYEAILRQRNMRAVVDVERYNRTNPSDQPPYEFQYPPTLQLMNGLNNSSPLESTRVRTEYPASNIMHNKFFVFENAQQKTLWTGTANISKNCTGDEDFANLAVYIENKAVAESYLKEFDEMFNFAPADAIRAPQRVGRFHTNKFANTPRYFKFKDGSELRIHFSPTDDGEHRSILPMIHSAKPGDVIRISMFGSAGIEYIRAMQQAAALGAHVKVFLDRDTSFQISNSWINRKSPVRLQGPNPYGPLRGSLEVRYTNWGAGRMNHHKTATLTRKTTRGLKPELIIVGSQNWSIAGNDENDENMLTIRNTERGLDIVSDFNEHFDTMLWATGQIVPQE